MIEEGTADNHSPELVEDAVDASEDYDDESDEETDVQLGFIEKSDRNILFKDSDWRNWDGGVVGGRPIWLNPADIPDTKALQCRECSDPLKFLLQIYCPIDEVVGAFHRALYLFCCRNRQCLNAGSVKCLRVQLPRENDFYSIEPADLGDAHATRPSSLPTLCALCGCRGALMCGQCKITHYCSKAHQKEHWKCHKLLCSQGQGGGLSTTASAALEAQVRAAEEQVLAKHLFPELSVAVEAEVFEGQDEQEMKAIMEKANIWEDAVTEGGADEAADAKLTQADYQKALGSEVHDPTYINFLTRVERGGGDQVLRYCRTPAEGSATKSDASDKNKNISCSGGRSTQGLLLLSSNPQLLKDRAAAIQSSPCPRCGAPRTFECQVMPQLLHFLKVDQHTRLMEAPVPAPAAPPASAEGADGGADGSGGEVRPPAVAPEKAFYNKSDKDIDWGSLDVFTCSASCDARGGADAYAEELVLIQPPVYHNK